MHEAMCGVADVLQDRNVEMFGIVSRVAIQSIEHKRYWYRFCRWAIYRSVGRSVCLSGALCKNGLLDLGAVWGGGSAGSKDEMRQVRRGWRLEIVPHEETFGADMKRAIS